MKYVSITPSETLSSLADKVGYQNVDQLLSDNQLKRVPNIGKQWTDKCKDIIATNIF